MQLIIDFGLVVLIWMVQLVVYPGFAYYNEKNLQAWHEKYTLRITVIVLPLMLAQLWLHVISIWESFDWLKLVLLVMILIVWLNTFLIAVPLHRKISNNLDSRLSSLALVKINWYRTVLWSLIFVVQLCDQFLS